MRRPSNGSVGSLVSPSGDRFTVRVDRDGIVQSITRGSDTLQQRIAYVIGSGRHASGYLIQAGADLFQSPICYYTGRRAYDLAPGYERIAAPDFTRSVGEQCILCHADADRSAISCDRCHGPVAEHLRTPAPGSIVNPAKLPQAARDSVCEQCHLAGVARIPNPGKTFAEFRAGQALEDVFTVYTRPAARDFRVISHAEQLARSACARASRGNLWCGTCHDPHPAAPATAATYNARCIGCHHGPLKAAHPAGADCIACHMTRREALDGAHTVFTDHRITRSPPPDAPAPPADELSAWREPDPAFRTRNLALAYLEAGVAARSPAQIVRGYRLLTEAEKTAPEDVAVLRGLGRALLLGKQPVEALRAFERVLALTPADTTSAEDAGVAALEAGQIEKAVARLEAAVASDPFLLTAVTALQEAYRRQGRSREADALAARVRGLGHLPVH
jgi:tetratricopeptide (TPR) repeat protein